MAWLRSHSELRQHPKTRKLARRVGGLATAVGHLHLLWWWTMDYAPDGDLSRYSDEEIADAGEWTGDAAEFVEMLRTAGFLDGSHIHDWQENGGQLVARRARDAARKRVDRQAPSNGRPTDVQRTSDGRRKMSAPIGEERRRDKKRAESVVVVEGAPVDNSAAPVESASASSNDETETFNLIPYSRELAQAIADRKMRARVVAGEDCDTHRQVQRLLQHVRSLAMPLLGEYEGDALEQRLTAVGKAALADLKGASNPAALITKRLKCDDLADLGVSDDMVSELRKRKRLRKAADQESEREGEAFWTSDDDREDGDS
jgi:dipeptidyl aminopeptidase/acylaminoacyl peptidase